MAPCSSTKLVGICHLQWLFLVIFEAKMVVVGGGDSLTPSDRAYLGAPTSGLLHPST